MRTKYQRREGIGSVLYPYDISMRLRDWRKLRLSSLVLRILLLASLVMISTSGALGALQASISGPASPDGDAFLNVCDPSPLAYYTATISNPAGGAPASAIQATITLPEGFYYAGFTTIQFPGGTSSQGPISTTDPDTGVTSLAWNISRAVHGLKTVALNEILLSPDGYPDADQKIELYNSGPDPVDISGWYIHGSSGPVYEAPSGTVMAPGSFLVLTPSSLEAHGEALTLYDASSIQMDQVIYTDSSIQVGLSYACLPDGSGSFDWRSSTIGATNGGGSLNPGEIIAIRFAIGAGCKSQSGQVLRADLTCNNEPAISNTSSEVPLHRAELNVTREPGIENRSAGEMVAWTLNVHNTGDGPAYNTVLKDALGSGMTFAPEGTSLAPDSISGNPAILTWNLGEIPAGGSQTINVSVNVSSSGDLSDDASAVWGCGPDPCGTAQNQPDAYRQPNGSQAETEDDLVTVDVYSPVLAISQAPSIATAGPGEAATWIIVVENTGDCAAKHVWVKDWLPSNVDSPISNRTFSGTGSDQDPLVWDLPEIAPGERVCISLTATVAASRGCQDDTRNTARVYWGCCPDAFMPLTSEATLMTRPSLVAAFVTDSMSTCGGTYVATVSNPSDDFEVQALEVIDVVPEGLVYVAGSARIVSPPGHAILGTPAYDGVSRTLNFTIDEIGKSETVTIAFDLKNCQSCCSDIAPNTANSLTLQYLDACGNAVTRPNTWPIDLQLPDLSVSKTPRVQEADSQGGVGWDITVNNTGNGQASNVEITDILGNGFTDIDASDGTSLQDPHTGWTTIKWSNQTIDAGTVWQRHITARLTNPQGDTTNSIEAKGSCISNGCTYSQPSRDSTTSTSVTASKGPDQIGIPGQYIDFPIDVRFDGNVLYDNVSLTDTLPPELDYVSGRCTGCGGDPAVTASDGNTTLSWDLGSFTGPRVVSFTVSTVINASALPGADLTNDLAVSYTSGGVAFHVPASARVTVAPPASLGDLVWSDDNANGIQDEGEMGIAGVRADLLKSGAPLESAITDSGGRYTFDGLSPGSYSLKFNLPAGFVFSAPMQGTDRAADSDADESLGRTAEIQLSSGQADDTADAGMYRPASIGDKVWKDVNANGIQDSGEPGMPGVLVELFKSGASVGATATDYHGIYSFAGLAPGNYSLRFSLPAGFVFSTPRQGADTARDSDADVITGLTASAVLASGQSDMTWDAGVYGNASLGDFVWEDINGNGVQDEGEPGVGHAEVGLYTSSGDLVGSNATDFTGHYAFMDIAPGDYYLDFASPDGYSFTINRQNVDRATDSDAGADGKTDIVTLTSGQNDTTWDAGLYRNASLGDLVWDDRNTNGIQDQGEPGISYIVADLYRLDFNTGTYSKVLTNSTVSNGSYSFTSISPGKYYVIFEKTANYVFSAANQGSDLALDSDVCVVTGQTGDIQLDSGQTNDTVDAGMYRLASIGDLVWIDDNANGIQDEGEMGLPGVSVELIKSGASVEATATDCNGSYNFTGLTPGNYSLKFDLPAGFVFSALEQGADTGRDSNADVVTGMTASAVLASGQSDMAWDAGVYRNASLGDFVWEDMNGNGAQDEGEPGVGQAEVGLYTSSGDLVGSNATDFTGHYAFMDIAPGDYYLDFVGPDGYSFTINHENIDRAADSDAGADGKTGLMNLTSGQNDTTWDAGLYRNASLGDFVWDDYNTNGVQDQGEPGIPGVAADLYRFDINASIYSKILSNTTDSNGSYSFASLMPGRYHVIFEKPSDYVFSPANQGTDSAMDSNADVSTGQTGDVHLDSGQIDDTVDAGLYKLASLGELVWNDLNSNGIQDSGEPGVAGVQVNLYACSNRSSAILASTATDDQGNYHFRDLLPGAYFIGLAAPQGYNFTLQDQGFNDSLDSDVNQSESNTTCISLAAGQNDTTWDAGLVAVQPPLTVEKTTDSELIVPQTEINSTINITNTGDAALDSVSVVDRLPEGLSYVSDNRTGSVSGQNVTWSDLGPLEIGNSTYIELACIIDEGASGTLTDMINVTGTSSGGIVLNGSAESNLTVMAPAVEIRCFVDQAAARLCSDVVYTLNVTNTGNFTLSPVKVLDILPAGMDFNHSQPEPLNIVRNPNGTTALTWEDVGPLDPGASLKIFISCQLSEEATGTLENFAAAEAKAPDGAVVKASDSVDVTTMPSLIEVSNDASMNAAEIGSNVTFTMKVTNLGGQALDPVMMDYSMQKGLDFVSTDSKQPYTAAKNPDGGWTIDWEDIGPGPLQAGESAAVNLVGRIKDDATGILTAEAKVAGILPDGAIVDYCSIIAGVKVEVPSIVVVKEANTSSGAPGSNISFAIRITNNGDLALSPVRVVDMLPSGLSYITDNRSGSVSGRNISWDNLGPMNPGASAFICLIARIDKGASGTLENIVEATGESPAGFVGSSSRISVRALVPEIKVEKTVGLPEPAQYGQFCDSKTVSGTGRVESAMAIRDSRLALAYDDALSGDGDIDLSSVQAMSEKAGKLQRSVPSLSETNKSSMNFFEASKIDFRGDTPLTGSKSIRSDSLQGGMGASIEESFQADKIEKDQAAYFGSTSNATGAQVAGIDTNSSFNGTMEAAQNVHKIFEKDLRSHSRFSGKFDLERNVKIHQNATEKRRDQGCEGIDC